MEMEDAHTIEPEIPGLPGHSLFAVFDGHGGHNAALFASKNLLSCLMDRESFTSYMHDQTNREFLMSAMKEAFLEVDSKMRLHFRSMAALDGERSGCTAIAVIVTPTHVVCANAGDSRALLYSEGTEGKNVELSHDHKPWMQSERQRIEEAGGCVSMKRVDGELAVSRALGDFQYKSETLPPEQTKVTASPEVIDYERVPEQDWFFVLACDGIWDVMSNEDVIRSVTTYMTEHGEGNPQLMAEEMMCESLAKSSRDNMSVVVVLFQSGLSKVASEGAGVEGLRAIRAEAEQKRLQADGARGV